jgi:hypothetical protein
MRFVLVFLLVLVLGYCFVLFGWIAYAQEPIIVPLAADLRARGGAKVALVWRELNRPDHQLGPRSRYGT